MTSGSQVQIIRSKDARVGAMPVRRALPRFERRMVGAWCFIDHFGPVGADRSDLMQVGPHPHIGLQTVTWLLEGEVLHTDSLGSEQLIRPGQLNLMTAGHGIVHAESARPGGAGSHGIQLWIAQPQATRNGSPAFRHLPDLPQVDLEGGVATVLVGTLEGSRSPARTATPILGADVQLRPGATVIPLQDGWEHAVLVSEGAVDVDRVRVEPGALAYLGDDRDQVVVRATEPSRILVVGGEPFGEEIVMWWNFVARTNDEIEVARSDWKWGGERFPEVASPLGRIGAPRTPFAEPTVL